MPVAVTSKAHTMVTSPGANSQASAAIAHVTGRLYVVMVFQTRLSSTNPITPTPSGLGVTTWNTAIDFLWQNAATARRRGTVFWGYATSTGSTAFTATYTGQTPADVWLIVDEVTGMHPTAPITNAVTNAAVQTLTANVLYEPVTMAALQSADSRCLIWGMINVSWAPNIFRPELDADTNGDADWTILGTSTNTASSPTASVCHGWNNSGIIDLTPGLMQTSGTTSQVGLYALEIIAAPAAPTDTDGWGWNG